MWKREKKPIVGVFGLSGCAGDQLAIIHMEDVLVDFFTSADIKYYHMAQSHQEVDHVNVALVEGSVNTSKQETELKEIREKADIVVALGTCAAHGGIQFLGEDEEEFKERLAYVYGKDGIVPEFLDMIGQAQAARPISDFIKVDFTVPGCPVAKENLIPIYTKLISDLQPVKYPYSVCLECKYQGNDCFLLHGKYCLGPITSAGCDARCPSLNVSCVGCFGPFEAANYESMIDKLKEIGLSEEEILRKIKMFGGSTAKAAIGGMKK
ncbi:MAG: NADH:ubiquinone oxidoreductase [Candidatus Heimdallarchaeota archaeon]|nr:NADH:ubiquinone oxidoreductase [Candidatus Heimdallarchaeota archaeon]MCK4955881.1 NADH:ubiquinone oxidoreductase [Candidatus Heimdallarchaeota archaeon]